ncbi:hypothetical protein A4X13_0g6747 [Tilletia indica]|uniref:Uncharacterized protein n=1 Tax=Tilletia indica TaxID=43049 RepID=A0A8T8SNV3_9BASI|nr:hypothetical protein A4X13_0g6747 [Tilletia indica]
MNDIRRLQAKAHDQHRSQQAHDKRAFNKQARLKAKFGDAYVDPRNKRGMFAAHLQKHRLEMNKAFDKKCREDYAEALKGNRQIRKCSACAAWNERHPGDKQVFQFMHSTFIAFYFRISTVDNPASTFNSYGLQVPH